MHDSHTLGATPSFYPKIAGSSDAISMGKQAIIPPTPLTPQYLKDFLDKQRDFFSLFYLPKPINSLNHYMCNLFNNSYISSALNLSGYSALRAVQASPKAHVSKYMVVSDLINLLWNIDISLSIKIKLLTQVMDIPVIEENLYYAHLRIFTEAWDVVLFSATVQIYETMLPYTGDVPRFYPAESSTYEDIYAYAMTYADTYAHAMTLEKIKDDYAYMVMDENNDFSPAVAQAIKNMRQRQCERNDIVNTAQKEQLTLETTPQQNKRSIQLSFSYNEPQKSPQTFWLNTLKREAIHRAWGEGYRKNPERCDVPRMER